MQKMDEFSTKLKGDIAEYRVISELLIRGVEVLIPIGDRLSYDMAIVVSGKFKKIQIKMAWPDKKTGSYQVDIRRSQTNRKRYKSTKYKKTDFDFLIAYIVDKDTFYIFPSDFACSYGSIITMVEDKKRERKPRAEKFRNAWNLLL